VPSALHHNVAVNLIERGVFGFTEPGAGGPGAEAVLQPLELSEKLVLEQLTDGIEDHAGSGRVLDLRDHDPLLEVLEHGQFQAHVGGTLAVPGHLVDFVL